ncbi:MAG: hypothetical protein QW265_05205 [Candidatus Bathyarchaeia archaeon]
MAKYSFIKGLNYTLEFNKNELKFKKRTPLLKKQLTVDIKKIRSVEQTTKSFFPPFVLSIILSIILATMIALKSLEPLRIPSFYREVLISTFIIGISSGLIMALTRSFFVSIKFKLDGYDRAIIVYFVNRKEGKKFVEELVNRLTQASK